MVCYNFQGAVKKRAERMKKSNEEMKIEFRCPGKAGTGSLASVESEVGTRKESVVSPVDIQTAERNLDDFVDSLFDPLFSSDVNNLVDAPNLSRSIKGDLVYYCKVYIEDGT